MSGKIAEILEKIGELERELEAEFEKKRSELQYWLEKRKVHFDPHVVAEHRKLKRSLLDQIKKASFTYIITAPFIYSMIVPLVILDLFVWTYQAVCFTAYRIPKVRRSDYIFMDRQKLAYLNLFEKFNCLYCGYANGLLAYAGEIAGRTEQYWCPIKHAHKIASPHSRYNRFLEFGDAEGYEKEKETWKASTDFEDLKKARGKD